MRMCCSTMANTATEIIEALARFGAGLPANVLPMRVNEVTQVGPEAVAALFAYGAANVSLLARAMPKHDMLGTQRIVEASNRIMEGLGFGAGLVSGSNPTIPMPARDARRRSKRQGDGQASGFRCARRQAWRHGNGFARTSPCRTRAVPVIALDKGALFGGVNLNVKVHFVPLLRHRLPVRGAVRQSGQAHAALYESLCVQCGLCQSTCPEKVIHIEPRVDFDAWNAGTKTLNEEEPSAAFRAANRSARRVQLNA